MHGVPCGNQPGEPDVNLCEREEGDQPVGVLQRFERRIEELVNKPFAKAFKSEVEPVEIAGALQRECDDRAAIVSRGTTMVPNSFVVELGKRDHDRLAVYSEPLGAELASMVREHANDRSYTFVGPVEVAFERADDLDTGMFRVRSSAVAGPLDPPPARPEPPAPAPVAVQAPVPGRGYQPPSPAPAPAVSRPWLEIGGVDVELRREVVVIGRGQDVDVRLEDPGVSRRHAELRLTPRWDPRSGEAPAAVRDLGSTNGLVVDGRQVERAALADGSRLVLGGTVVVFHAGSR